MKKILSKLFLKLKKKNWRNMKSAVTKVYT